MSNRERRLRSWQPNDAPPYDIGREDALLVANVKFVDSCVVEMPPPNKALLRVVCSGSEKLIDGVSNCSISHRGAGEGRL
jgi:hypothetical protein